jgi:hypothetical protein
MSVSKASEYNINEILAVFKRPKDYVMSSADARYTIQTSLKVEAKDTKSKIRFGGNHKIRNMYLEFIPSNGANVKFTLRFNGEHVGEFHKNGENTYILDKLIKPADEFSPSSKFLLSEFRFYEDHVKIGNVNDIKFDSTCIDVIEILAENFENKNIEGELFIKCDCIYLFYFNQPKYSMNNEISNKLKNGGLTQEMCDSAIQIEQIHFPRFLNYYNDYDNRQPLLHADVYTARRSPVTGEWCNCALANLDVEKCKTCCPSGIRNNK